MFNLIIAVAGGKGGCGKTTVAVNLALSLASEKKVLIADCDVEEPNVHLLIRHKLLREKVVSVFTPKFDMEKCTLCGICADFCQYHAIVKVLDKLLFFQELCHGCEGCRYVCPKNAIVKGERVIGVVRECVSEDDALRLVYGVLNVGEPRASPLIEAVRRSCSGDVDVVVIDAPPGTACPVIASIKDVDHVLLVTEPTPMGFYDLKLIVDVARRLGLSFSVVVNKAGLGDVKVYEYCEKERIPIVLEIPYDRGISELYSRGIPIVKAIPNWRERFVKCYECICEMM